MICIKKCKRIRGKIHSNKMEIYLCIQLQHNGGSCKSDSIIAIHSLHRNRHTVEISSSFLKKN